MRLRKVLRLIPRSLAARNWSQDKILAFMGATDDSFPKDQKTLRKYFSRELQYGQLFIEGMAAQALVAKMMTGSLGAINKVLAESAAAVPPAKPGRPYRR